MATKAFLRGLDFYKYSVEYNKMEIIDALYNRVKNTSALLIDVDDIIKQVEDKVKYINYDNISRGEDYIIYNNRKFVSKDRYCYYDEDVIILDEVIDKKCRFIYVDRSVKQLFSYEDGEISFAHVYAFVLGDWFVKCNKLENCIHQIMKIEGKWYTPCCLIHGLDIRPNGTLCEIRKEVLKTWQIQRLVRINKVLEVKYGFRTNVRSALQRFRIFKQRYKKLRKLLKKKDVMRRYIINGSPKMDGLRAAGWEFYKNCKAKEPSDKVFPDDMEVEIDKNWIRYEIYLIGRGYSDNIYIPLEYGEMIGLKKGKYVIKDARIAKYLKKVPSYLDTKLEDVPYFKWAVQELLNNRIH